MKTKKVLKVIFTVLLLITIFILYNANRVKTNEVKTKAEASTFSAKQSESSEDVYDVILFFGQSNMSGSMSEGIETRYQLDNSETVRTYSKNTDIDEDIINLSWLTNYTVTDVQPNTVYEYHVLDNSLYDLSDLESDGYTVNGADVDTKKFNGELLYYDYTKYKFYGVWSNDRPSWINDKSYSFSNAYGTNMINEFAKQYYEKTGHKVVCVSAAYGGQPLEHFVPGVIYQDSYGTNINLYAGMSNKYLAAIRYLESNNLKIGNRFFVMFQGENEAGANSQSIIPKYKEDFKKIKEQLKQDLGINKGAIVLTGFQSGIYNGESFALGVKSVNQAQTELINEDPDVFLGTDYPFKHYVPGEEDYNNTTEYSYKENMKGLDYNTALEHSKLIVGDGNGNNLFHYTSATLAQIGRETANNMYNAIRKDVSELEILLEQNDYIYDGTGKIPKVIVKDENNILTNGVDYTVEYQNNVNVGTAIVKITGQGIYTGSINIPYNIKEAQIEINVKEYNGIYDGKSHGISIDVKKPMGKAIVKYGENEGIYNEAISPEFINSGDYTVYYEVTAEGYTTKRGSAHVKIAPKNISGMVASLQTTNYIYDGKEKRPKVELKDGETILTENRDYILRYSDNVNIGTAIVTIEGIGNYEGNLTKQFEIKEDTEDPDIDDNPNDDEVPDIDDNPNDDEDPDIDDNPNDDEAPNIDNNQSDNNNSDINIELDKEETQLNIKPTENKEDNTSANGKIPQTGMNKNLILLPAICLTCIISIICFIKYKKWNY